jgi:hypothetical protein
MWENRGRIRCERRLRIGTRLRIGDRPKDAIWSPEDTIRALRFGDRPCDLGTGRIALIWTHRFGEALRIGDMRIGDRSNGTHLDTPIWGQVGRGPGELGTGQKVCESSWRVGGPFGSHQWENWGQVGSRRGTGQMRAGWKNWDGSERMRTWDGLDCGVTKI